MGDQDRRIVRSDSSMSWPFTRRNALSADGNHPKTKKNVETSNSQNRRCHSGPSNRSCMDTSDEQLDISYSRKRYLRRRILDSKYCKGLIPESPNLLKDENGIILSEHLKNKVSSKHRMNNNVPRRIRSTLSIVYEKSENSQRISTFYTTAPKISFNNDIVRTDGKNRELKSALKKSNECKKIISFFQDLKSMSQGSIDYQESLSVSIEDMHTETVKLNEKPLENKVVSKYSAYKSLINRIEHKVQNYKKSAKCDTIPTKGEKISKNKKINALKSSTSSETDARLQNKIDLLNKDLECMVKKRNQPTSFNSIGQRDKKETPDAQSEMNLEVLNCLTSSSKILNEFVHSTKKSTYMVNKVFKRKISLQQMCKKPNEITSKRETDSAIVLHDKNNLKKIEHRHLKMVSRKKSTHDIDKTLTPSNNLSISIFPESTNFLKHAVQQEMSHRVKRIENDEQFYEGLENSLKEHVKNLVNDLRTKSKYSKKQSKIKTNELEKHESIDEKFNNKIKEPNTVSKVNFSIPKSKASKKATNKEDYEGFSKKYNKALREFKEKLLDSDSDSSIRAKRNLKTLKTSPKHRKLMKKTEKADLKDLDISCSEAMKNRKLEVEQKLKKYSRKRANTSEKKKSANTSERVKTITDVTKRPIKDYLKVNAIDKTVKKKDGILQNGTTCTKWKDNENRNLLEHDENYKIIPKVDGLILSRRNEALHITLIP